MTEAEWFTCRNPHDLLDCFQEASERKVRLFAAACCRRAWTLLIDERSREAIEVSEQFADGRVTSEDLLSAAREAESVAQEDTLGMEPVIGATGAATAAALATRQPTLYDPAYHPADHQLVAESIALAGLEPDQVAQVYIDQLITNDYYRKIHEEKAVQTRLLRDILGNPFRSIVVDPHWLTTSVVELARTVYEDRAFDRLPVLADALEEAGCHDADILGHCRQPGEHVRGCWVVDLLLGKE